MALMMFERNEKKNSSVLFKDFNVQISTYIDKGIKF